MPDMQDTKVGDALPERTFEVEPVQQFLYNAALWNAHRIHYDHPYATGVEGYPGVVNAGTLVGDWLTQCVTEWLGDGGDLVRFEYSNRKASFVGDTLSAGGKVVAVDVDSGTVELELSMRDADGQVIAPGKATVRLTGG